MWRLRFRTDSLDQYLGSLAKEFGVDMTGYPLSYEKKGKFIHLTVSGIMFGEEISKKRLRRELRNSKMILDFEINEDFSLVVVKQPLASEPLFDRKLIYLNPVLIKKDGKHFWDIASFDRVYLEKIIKFIEKNFEGKILSFKDEKVNNISFTRLLPLLTENQKRAMEIAFDNGYYDYPKKIRMVELAKMMGISFSTYQAHLKKAESKILPILFRN